MTNGWTKILAWGLIQQCAIMKTKNRQLRSLLRKKKDNAMWRTQKRSTNNHSLNHTHNTFKKRGSQEQLCYPELLALWVRGYVLQLWFPVWADESTFYQCQPSASYSSAL